MGKKYSTIKITQDRFEELIDIETRANVAVEIIINDEYAKSEDILRIIGTKQALIKADKIKEKKRRQEEEYRNKYAEENNAAL